jgi:hypothetical protein
LLRNCLEEATKADVPVLKMLRIFPDSLHRHVAIGNGPMKAITAKAEIELDEPFLVHTDSYSKRLYLYLLVLCLHYRSFSITQCRYELCGIQIYSATKFHNHILRNWNNLVAGLSNDKQFQV